MSEVSRGAFIAEILNEKGEVLAQGVGTNEDDAILELADELKRPR